MCTCRTDRVEKGHRNTERNRASKRAPRRVIYFGHTLSTFSLCLSFARSLVATVGYEGQKDESFFFLSFGGEIRSARAG